MVLIRTGGVLLLLIGFVVQFWVTPQKGVSLNEKAAANVARMEAQVAGSSATQAQHKPQKSPFLKAFESKREQQVRYATIIAMLLGIGFLVYSFFAGKKE